MINSRIIFYAACACILFSSFSQSQPLLDPITIIKLSGKDSKAIVKNKSGQLTIIQKTDIIEGYGAVIEISDKRIVFEDTQHPGCESIIITLENGKQQIRRITSIQNFPDLKSHNITSENSCGDLPIREKKNHLKKKDD